MLVLTRKIGEKIVIGEDIIITILDGGRGDGVRIGIEAPRNVTIHRSEVVDAVAAETVAAAAATVSSVTALIEALRSKALPDTNATD